MKTTIVHDLNWRGQHCPAGNSQRSATLNFAFRNLWEFGTRVFMAITELSGWTLELVRQTVQLYMDLCWTIHYKPTVHICHYWFLGLLRKPCFSVQNIQHIQLYALLCCVRMINNTRSATHRLRNTCFLIFGLQSFKEIKRTRKKKTITHKVYFQILFRSNSFHPVFFFLISLWSLLVRDTSLLTHSRDDSDQKVLALVKLGLQFFAQLAFGALDVILGGSILSHQV